MIFRNEWVLALLQWWQSINEQLISHLPRCVGEKCIIPYPEFFCSWRLFEIGFQYLGWNTQWQCEKYDMGRCKKCNPGLTLVLKALVKRAGGVKDWKRALLTRAEGRVIESGFHTDSLCLCACLTKPRAPPGWPKEGKASPSPGKLLIQFSQRRGACLVGYFN